MAPGTQLSAGECDRPHLVEHCHDVIHLPRRERRLWPLRAHICERRLVQQCSAYHTPLRQVVDNQADKVDLVGVERCPCQEPGRERRTFPERTCRTVKPPAQACMCYTLHLAC